MKNRLILIAAIVFQIGCNQSKDSKNELNYIAFKVSKDALVDSLKTATELLDKMDYGNGATCFVKDGKLHHTRKEKGFDIVDMPVENSSSGPIIEPLDQGNSFRLLNLVNFLNKNGIHGLVKRWDGLCWFSYKQRVFNPYNDYNQSREIVYIKKPNDTLSKFFYKSIILDRYKNILLVAPDTYNEPKLPMDSASIMKRRDVISHFDTIKIQRQIKDFDYKFENIEKKLYDSVERYQTDGIDFSDITTGLERKYKASKDDTEKALFGYRLAKNYFLRYKSSGKKSFIQKADSLFYSFISFKDGKIASIYLKIDINKVCFIQNEWTNLSEQDKEAILFYGLLRGFNNGLPEVLKDVK